MKKVIFETVGNICIFILLGIALTKGIIIEREGEATVVAMNNIFIILLVIVVLYLVLLAIINKKQKGTMKHLFTGLQLRKDTDERDKFVTGEAAKATYLATMVVLGGAILLPLILRVYEGIFGWSIDYYEISIWTPIIAMVILNITFSIKWCIEYRK